MEERNDRENEGGNVPENDPGQGGEGQEPPPQGQQHTVYYQAPPPIPNSTAVLVLGIISIVTCFCYGLPGLICGIIALILSNKGFQAYRENPNAYSSASYSNLNAGRICAIIGVSLSGLYLLWVIIMFVIYGSALMATEPWANFPQ
jgi:hypothetical protein